MRKPKPPEFWAALAPPVGDAVEDAMRAWAVENAAKGNPDAVWGCRNRAHEDARAVP